MSVKLKFKLLNRQLRPKNLVEYASKLEVKLQWQLKIELNFGL